MAAWRVSADDFWRAALVAALIAVATRWPVEFRLRSQNIAFTWTESAFLVSVVVVRVPILIVATAVGVLVGYLHRGVAARKIAFNVATSVVAAGCAVLAGRLVAADLDPSSWLGVLALGVAGLSWLVVGEILTDFVISSAQKVSFRSVALSDLGLGQFLSLVTVAVAVAVARLAAWQLAAVAILPVLAVILRQLHRSTKLARDHEQAIRDLETSTSALSRLDGAEVLDALITGVARLCRAECVEVALAEGTLVRGGRGGIDPDAEIAGFAAMTSTPLEVAGEHLGEIRLRFSEAVELTEAEHRALRTLASVGAVAIANARRHERTAYDAAHDPLTDLPNRRALLAATETALAEDPAGTALIVIDLDRFKDVNDTLGHATGDTLLGVVARRLQSAVGEDGIVARLGGDEFAILVRSAVSGTASAVVERVRNALVRPARLDAGAGAEVAVAVVGSIGVAAAVRDRADPDEPLPLTSTELLRRADVAMYRAKATHSGTVHYESASDPSNLQRLLMEPQLRLAFSDPDQLVVLYQPQVDLSTGSPVGAEALVRWNHPVYGLLMPEVVVPAVERAGLDHALTLLVLERSLTTRARWFSEYGVDVRIAVNLSPRMMLDRSLPDAVREALRRHHTRPERLIVEVPETVAVNDLDGVAGVLGALHLIGVQIALDDFGTGGAPLTLLARMPVDEVKMDRSFVAGMTTNATSAAIVRATLDLARSLDLRTVAEGVESNAVDRALRELGCDSGQGYHYGRPVDADTAGQVMADAKRGARSDESAGVIRLSTARRRPRL